MTKTALLALLPLAFASNAALAEATDEGAQHLTEVFQTYLGSTEGAVSVTPNGDAYDVTIDGSTLFGALSQGASTVTMAPFTLSLTDNGDGTWGVKQDQPFSMTTTDSTGATSKQDMARITMDGVFDENLMMLTSSTGTMEGWTATTTAPIPEGGTFTMEQKVAMTTATTTGTAGASGGVDVDAAYKSTGISLDIVLPIEGGAPTPIKVTMASADYDAKMTGLEAEGILGSVAFFVAHASEEAIQAAKDEAKSTLTAALPVWNNALIEGTMSGLTAETPIGPVSLDAATFTVDVNGAVADGKFREAFSVSGLTLPAGIVPDWAAPILPQKVSLDFEVTGFDAAAGITAALGVFDQPDGMADTTALDEAVQKAFLPDGKLTVSLNPSAVTGDGYELTYEGDMLVDMATEMPTGTAVITLTGVEKLQAALDAAPDDIKGQAMMGMGMAQGMAKPGPNGELVWEIDASTPGSLSVNGTPMMGGN